jgi:hypothetical protein
MALPYRMRVWLAVSDGVTVRSNLGNDEAPQAVRCAQLLRQLLVTLRRWLSGRTPYESESEWRMLYGTSGPRVADFTAILVQLSGAFLYGKEGRRGRFWGSDSSEDDEDGDSDNFDEDGATRRNAAAAGSGKVNRGPNDDDDRDRNGRSDRAEIMAEADPHWQLYFKLYDIISKINMHNEKLMVVGNVTKAGTSGGRGMWYNPPSDRVHETSSGRKQGSTNTEAGECIGASGRDVLVTKKGDKFS